jgi:inner membrane protein
MLQRSASVSFKMFLVGFLVILCYIPSLMVYGLVAERQGRQYEAIADIASKWGNAQVIGGPVVHVPFITSYRDEKGVLRQQTSSVDIAATKVDIKTQVQTEVRYRGIFRVPVYTAVVQVSGVLPSAQAALKSGTVLADGATMDVMISDVRGMIDQPVLQYGSATATFEPTSGEYGSVTLRAPLQFAPGADTPFSYSFTLRGTESLEFLPSAKQSTVSMESPWTMPSFVGSALPATHEITEKGFTARWDVSSWWAGSSATTVAADQYAPAAPDARFGVKLLETTDFYTLVDRAIKYAILFIGLTFMVLFLVEVLHTERVHPFQYILVGAALCLFYLLLLSLSEHVGFLTAYVLSAVATVVLVSGYSIAVLKHKRFGTSVGVLLAVLYGYLYALLQIEDYALLLGSVILFVILATVMFVTRNVDWYGKDPS